MANPKIKRPRVLIYLLLAIIVTLFGIVFLTLKPN
jgi:hypothetical protein